MSDTTMDEFRVGAVLGRSFSTYFRNIVAFGALALLLNAPIYLYQLVAGPSAGMASGGVPVGSIVLLAAQILLSYLLMATLVYGTVQDLRGQPASMGDCIARGIALLLPVIGVAILATLAMAVGAMLLIIPALILMVFWWVVIPVTVVEHPGVIAAFGRSAALTKGNRWRIFGLFLIIIALNIVIGMVVGLASVGTMLSTADLEAGQVSSSSSVIFIVVDWVLSSLVAAFWSVMAAVSYHDLRVAQEGVDSDQIAAVFD